MTILSGRGVGRGDALPDALAATPVGTAVGSLVAPVKRAADEASDAVAEAAARETVAEPVAARRGRRAEAVALAALGGFVAIFGIVRARKSEAFDLAVLLKVQRRGNRLLDGVMHAASWAGFPPQSRLVPPAIVGLLILSRQRTEAAFQLGGWGAAALSTVMKWLMRRPRPVAGADLRVVVAPLGGSSFPSGHVITYVGTYGFTAYLAHTRLRNRAGRQPIVAGLIALLALVGPSRIYQGHHWPTDVTASYLLGTSYLIALVELYRRVKARQDPSPG
jgi:undecaprenyl-diphosphatase